MSDVTGSLPPDLQGFVTSQVAAGLFADEGEVVAVAIRLLEQRIRDREEKLAALREELRPAMEELDCGLGRPLTPALIEDIKERGRQQLDRRFRLQPSRTTG